MRSSVRASSNMVKGPSGLRSGDRRDRSLASMVPRCPFGRPGSMPGGCRRGRRCGSVREVGASDVARRRGPQQRQRELELLAEDGDRPLHPGRSTRRQRPVHRPPDEDALGTERTGDGDVEAAAHAAVDPAPRSGRRRPRRPPPARRSPAGTRSSCRAPWLLTTIASTPCSTASRASSAVRMPFTTSGSDDHERIAARSAHTRLRCTGRSWRRDGAPERGAAVAGRDVREIAEGRQDEARPPVAVAVAEHRQVHRDDQGAETGRLGALDERAGDRRVGLRVQLEPARATGCPGRHGLDRVGGRRRQRVRDPCRCRPTGRLDLTVRMGQRLERHRRDRDREGARLADERGPRIDRGRRPPGRAAGTAGAATRPRCRGG